LSARLAATIAAPGSAPAVAALLLDPDGEVRRAAATALAVVAAPSSALAGALLGAIGRPGAPSRQEDEWEAIAEALERSVEPADAGRLAAAWKTARGPERPALARALAAAQAGRPITDESVVAQLVDALIGEG